MKPGPSFGGHTSSAHRPATGDIARHLSSIAATSLLVAANGLHRGQQSAVQELSAHVASDAHSDPALAAVSAWQDTAINADPPIAAQIQMRFTPSMVLRVRASRPYSQMVRKTSPFPM